MRFKERGAEFQLIEKKRSIPNICIFINSYEW